MRRLHRGRCGRRPRRQRHGDGHARLLRRRPDGAGQGPDLRDRHRRRGQPRSFASSSSWGSSRTRVPPDPVRQAEVIGCEGARCHEPSDGPPIVGAPAQRRDAAAGRRDRCREPRRHARVAVVGPNADDPDAQLGDWAGASGQADWMPDGHPRETVETVLDGFRAVAPADWTVTHARGAEIGRPEAPPRGGLVFPDGQPRLPVIEPASPDPVMIAEAVAAAQAGRLRDRRRRRQRRPDRRRTPHGDPGTRGRPGRPPRRSGRHRHAHGRCPHQLQAGGPAPVGPQRGRAHPSVQPGHARRPGHRRAGPGPDRTHRAAASVLRPARRPATRLLQRRARSTRRSVRRPHSGPAVRLRRGAQLLHRRVHRSRRTQPGSGTGRHHPCGGDPDQHRRPSGAGDRSGVCQRPGHARDLGGEGAQVVPAGPGRPRRSSRPYVSELPANSCTLVTADGRRIVEPGEFALRVGASSRTTDLLGAGFRIGAGAHRG